MPPGYTATIGATAYKVVMLPENQVTVDGVIRTIDFVDLGGANYSLIMDGRVYNVTAPLIPASDRSSLNGNDARDLGSQVCVIVDGVEYDVRVDNEHTLALRSFVAHQGDSASPQVVRAPMPGIISRLEVEVGDEVTPGKGLLVLEAMKMENEIRSLTEGRIQTIHVSSGKVVEKGEPLVTIQRL
jgi:biotin carboxyl carrier protein